MPKETNGNRITANHASSLLDKLLDDPRYKFNAVKKIYKVNPPFCEHGNTSTLYLSRSKANFNRAFFKCAKGYDPCPYFQWADEEPNKFTLSQNHPRPGYFAQKPVLPPTPTPTKYKKKKRELKFLPAVKRITSITFPPDEELVAPKRKKGIQGKQENQERDSITITDHRVARREQPRSRYTVYVPRHSKHRTVV